MELKVAIVIPWFGRDLKGGAEKHTFQVVTNLLLKGVDATILTTCSKSFHESWSHNHYKSGDSTEDNIPIKRFPVTKQRRHKFDKSVKRLLSVEKDLLKIGVSPVTKKDEKIYIEENINSPKLLQYIDEHKNNYDVFVFIPYLFPMSILGVNLVKDKAAMIPCLHDECYAYLQSVRHSINQASKLCFNSKGEYILAKTLYGPSIKKKSLVTGGGIEIDLAKFDQPLDPIIEGKYLLYLGKRCKEKNTHTLIKDVEKYISQTGSDLKLVLAGPADLPIKPTTKQVIDLGLVSEEDKYKLLKHCTALVNPSINESLSRIIFEAWGAKKPVIVHQKCLATYEALKDSGFSGFAYNTHQDFLKILKQLDQGDTSLLHKMGVKGYHYMQEVTDWGKISDRFIQQFNEIKKETTVVRSLVDKINILFLAETIVINDAVGNDVIEQLTYFEELGFSCSLYAQTSSPELDRYAISKTEVRQRLQNPDTVTIFHHSTNWGEILDLILKSNCTLFFRYHNVTPPEFFAPYHKGYHRATTEGRELTSALVKSKKFNHYLACSSYNASELMELGVSEEEITVLSPFHRIPDFANASINPVLKRQLDNGCIQVLFVGRTAPNKGHKHLIHVIHEYVKHYGDNIQLNIVGSIDIQLDLYQKELSQLISKLKLEDNVIFRHMSSFTDLNTYYKFCDAFLLMSEHEGFCVPILEAQYHRLPLIALDRCAVKNTAGKNQMVISKLDYKTFACALRTITSEQEVVDYLAENGFQNYLRYEKNDLSKQLFNVVTELILKPER